MSSRNSSSDALRSALDALLHDGEPPTPVRDDIWASWRRSATSGLSPEHFSVPYADDGDHDGLLVRAARPVLDSLVDDLASTNVGLVLTDRRRRHPRPMGSRAVAREAVRPCRSRAGLRLRGIGRRHQRNRNAIAERKPTFVRGSEHFADALTGLACAAAPIIDPRTGHVLGVVDLTCGARRCQPIDACSRAPRRPRDRGSLARRHRVRGAPADEAVLAGTQRRKASDARRERRVVITNTAAERLVKAEDEPLLRHHAAEFMAQRSSVGGVEIMLTNGEHRHHPLRAGLRRQCRGRCGHASRGRRRPSESPDVGSGRPHRHRARHCRPRRRRSHQPADRGTGVRLPAHRRLPPPIDLPEGRGDLAHRSARVRSSGRSDRLRDPRPVVGLAGREGARWPPTS